MKMINSAALTGLPREVLSLIRDGVYSLYSLPAGAAAQYLLVTNNNEFYFLSADGHPQQATVARLDEIELDQLVSFSDLPDGRDVQLNWAV